MPKANKVGASRITSKSNQKKTTPLPTKTAPKTTDESNTTSKDNSGETYNLDEQNDDNNLSRGQKKRLARRSEFLKKLEVVNSSLKIGEKAKAKKVGTFQQPMLSLKDALSNLEKKELEKKEALRNKPQFVSNKSKKNVALTELSHFKLVLQHPTFQSDPFSTIMEHLDNTLPSEVDHAGASRGNGKGGEVKKVEKEVVKRNGSRRGGTKRR